MGSNHRKRKDYYPPRGAARTAFNQRRTAAAVWWRPDEIMTCLGMRSDTPFFFLLFACGSVLSCVMWEVFAESASYVSRELCVEADSAQFPPVRLCATSFRSIGKGHMLWSNGIAYSMARTISIVQLADILISWYAALKLRTHNNPLQVAIKVVGMGNRS